MNDTPKDDYHNTLKLTMDKYVNRVYDFTVSFPRDELFGVTSQIRRSSLSIILNYIEGYARRTQGNLKNFLNISFDIVKNLVPTFFLKFYSTLTKINWCTHDFFGGKGSFAKIFAYSSLFEGGRDEAP